MTLAELTTILSRVCRDHPELAADEKVRRYILLVVEEARKLPVERPPPAPCDVMDI